jgi:hypothetical protein
VHIISVIVWLGFGFCALWLGRVFLRCAATPAGAPLARFLRQCDLVIFGATLLAFAAGTTMALALGWGFFRTPWLGLKQAIMFGVLGGVAVILPRAVRFGNLVAALPPGPGPISDEIRGLYVWLEPWYLGMRIAGITAVVLAGWRPA